MRSGDSRRSLAAVYGAAIGQPLPNEGSATRTDLNWMQTARTRKLDAERLPRAVLALALVVLLAIVIWRLWSRTMMWALAGILVYLLVFNLRYTLLNDRTYSLSSVTGANELIVYVALNTLLAFVVGWLVFALGAKLFRRPTRRSRPPDRRLGAAGRRHRRLPAVFSFAFNGPLIVWTLPDFRSFFLGFPGHAPGAVHRRVRHSVFRRRRPRFACAVGPVLEDRLTTSKRSADLIAITCATMTQHGVVLLLAGALLPAMMKTFDIREGAAGILLGAGALGFVIGPMLSGLLSDRKGVKAVVPRGPGGRDRPADHYGAVAHLSIVAVHPSSC